MAELRLIELSLLDDHPKNPRVVIREDVIEGIVAGINGSFPQQHALHVRELDGRYQIISGHHRKRAATKKGLSEVWCWVEEMDDESAFMALATSNNQGELDPLEIGIHAFEAVPVAKGGRGKKGGLSEYAAKIGKKQNTVSEQRHAGEVVLNVSVDRYLFLGRAQHLAAIHKLPKECWESACAWLASDNEKLSVVKVADIVERCIACVVASENHSEWFERSDLFNRVCGSPDFNASTVKKLVALADLVKSIIDDTEALSSDEWDVFNSWLIENRGEDSWNYRKVEGEVEKIKAKVDAAEDAVSDGWRLGSYIDHVGDIDDGTVSLLLTDPPYGMDFQSNRRGDKHEKIESDGTVLEAADVLRDCLFALTPKMSDDCHILVFCRWDSEGAFQAVLRTTGFTVKGSLVWVKDNHGSGDLRGGFAPKHERIIHAVKGKPALFVREPDVLECGKVATDNHPTEKPIELLKRLIEATTVEGHLVVDPFAGVASTCVAANDLGRRWFGCEINEEYHKHGAKRLGG